jgi:hypothetical protein
MSDVALVENADADDNEYSGKKLSSLSTKARIALARRNFWSFRKFIHPEIIEGWWQVDVAEHLDQFYRDYVAGKRPKLVLAAPPQHGKSKQMVDFAAYFAGRNPDDKTIYASYSEDLGTDANRDLQRIYDDDLYKLVFPNTKISGESVVTQVGKWQRNSTFLEYAGHKGSFRNTTINGQITGKELHLGIIDDPIKGRAESSQIGNRNKAWDWLTDDFFARFHERAGMVTIGDSLALGRSDRPVGWSASPRLRLLRYPAIAEPDSPKYVRSDVDKAKRAAGEALFKEHISLDYLLERKRIYSIASWESLYQQNPIQQSGGC